MGEAKLRSHDGTYLWFEIPMKLFWSSLKKYLNEKVDIPNRKRYKAIGMFFLFQGMLVFLPIFNLVLFSNKYLVKSIDQQAHVIQFQYNGLSICVFGSIMALILTWMFGLRLTVYAFCTEKWKQARKENKKPYFNRFFFHIFKDDPVKQMWLEWGLWFLSLLFCLIMIMSPKDFQVHVNRKIFEHYGYVYCGNYQDNYGGTMELIFAREQKFCAEKKSED